MPSITFNGKTYNSLEEIPEQERQAYQQMMEIFVDKNGNGIPDFLEGDIVQNVSNIYKATSSIRFDSNTYSNFNELPPDVQSKVRTAFNQMAGIGIVSQNDYEEHASKHNVHNEAYVKPTKFVSREYQPVIEEEGNSNFKIWLMVGVGIMLCLAVAAMGLLAFLYL